MIILLMQYCEKLKEGKKKNDSARMTEIGGFKADGPITRVLLPETDDLGQTRKSDRIARAMLEAKKEPKNNKDD